MPWLMANVSIAMMLIGMTLSLVFLIQTGNNEHLPPHQVLLQVSTLLYAAIGGLITSRQPRNNIGWLFQATSFFTGLTAISVGYSLYQSPELASGLPSISIVDWINRWVWLPASMLPTIMVFLYFPDGRLLNRRWALVSWSAFLGLAGAVLSIALHPDAIESWDLPGPNPFGIPGAGDILEITLNASMAPMFIGAIGSVLALGLRFHRSKGIEREQMKWLVFAVGLTIVGAILATLAPPLFLLNESLASEISRTMISLGVVGIATAVGIAILRYRLYDINQIINRTLVYGSLTAAVIGIYLLVVIGLGLLFQAQGNLALSLLGVGMVAIIVQPVRDQL